jgi:drug/metabolite transporter (DMT)-like permease
VTSRAAYLHDRTAVAAWAAICVIWGTTYLAIKIALEGIPPFLIGGIRYVLAGATLLAWLVARGAVLPPVRRWGWFVGTGGLLLGIGNGGVVVAEQWVPSGLAAVLIATTPFWMVGVEAAYGHGESLSRQKWLGLIVGFLGIVLLVGPDMLAGGATGWGVGAGLVALQVACAGWAVGSSISRRLPFKVPPVQTAALQMVFGGIWMMGTGTLLGEWGAARFTGRAVGAVLYLTFVGGLAGFGAYIYALSRLPVSFVSLYTYVNPVIAVVLGTLLLDEPFGVRMALAMVVILGGMALVTVPGRAPRDPAIDDDRATPDPRGDPRGAP